jgi:protein involved in polysaccharide export with SLBB domain
MARTLLAAIVSIGLAAGCGHGNTSARQVPEEPVVGFDERLGVDDVFEIRVVGEPDLSGEYRVGNDGMIDYPYIGRVQVLALRPSELQQDLTSRLKDGWIRNPQIGVMVTQWNSRKVAVLGEVAKPGPLPYTPRMTIVDAIAAAGGFSVTAAKNSVRLRREANGRVETKSYRVADISEGRAPNVVILPGDVLVVDERIF